MKKGQKRSEDYETALKILQLTRETNPDAFKQTRTVSTRNPKTEDFDEERRESTREALSSALSGSNIPNSRLEKEWIAMIPQLSRESRRQIHIEAQSEGGKRTRNLFRIKRRMSALTEADEASREA